MSMRFDYLSWIKQWETSADNPTKFLTSLTIMNVTDFLIPTLRKIVKDDKISYSYDVRLLEALGDLIKTDTLEVKAISEIEGGAIEKIRVLLSPLCLDKLHIQSMIQHLDKISTACHSERFLKKLFSHIYNGLTSDEDRRTELMTLTDLAIQRLLTNYSQQYVKSLPRRIFADFILNPIKDKAKSEFMNDVCLIQGTHKVANHLLTVAAIEAERLLSSSLQLLANVSRDLFEKNLIGRDALSWTLENTKEELKNIENEVQTKMNRSAVNADNSRWFLPPNSVHSIFTHFLTQVSRVIIRYCLGAYPADYQVLQTQFVNEYFEQASNSVWKQMSSSQEMDFPRLNHKYDLVDAGYSAFIKILPTFLEPRIDNRIIKEEETKFNHYLVKLLETEPKEGFHETISAIEIENKLETKYFRVSLTKYMELVVARILPCILQSIVEVRLPHDESHSFERSFINEELDSCFRQMIERRKKSSGYDLMPLDLTKSDIESAFRHMSEELTITKAYRIFFIITNLNLKRRATGVE